MARHRHDLVRSGASLRKGNRSGLAHAVRRAMRQVCLTAPILELISKPVCGERLSVFGDQKVQIAELSCRDAGCKIRM